MPSEKPTEVSVFETARKIESSADREAYLAEACAGDAAFRQRVEKLLSAFAAESQRLEQSVAASETTYLPQSSSRNLAASLNAGLAPAFSGNQAIVVGDGSHSVLKMLGQTLDKVPRVVLRESAAEVDDPIVQPKSPEMPRRDSDSRYRLDGEIARGGMGAILKGHDTDLGRVLAIKVLLEAHKDRPEVVQRFIEEAQIGGQLQHPGIAPIYELGQFADQRLFFAMKLVKGQTLSKLLADRHEPAAERGRFIGIFKQVCQTMAYAHSRGVIHRDLKPANIMVGAFGEVQVMDWGLAKVLQTGGVADEQRANQVQQEQSAIQTLRSQVGSDSPPMFGTADAHTQMGSVMGTPAYMPPEQALGEVDRLDERADVFGLGAILCVILTGQPPYVGADLTAVFRQASRGKLKDAFSRLDACGADNDLIELAKHCLMPELTDRPRDAGVLASRITDYLESVEARLRDAEVERAAHAARADAEAAQAAAERQRAEAESERAQAQSARAKAESDRAVEARKRMRVTMALATESSARE
jgi:serine/threonine protein kinase